MRVLVTGGAGFIGSQMCRFLLEQGCGVTAYDNLLLGKKEFLKDLFSSSRFIFLERDLTADPDLKNVLAGHDLVIHLAANSDIAQGSQRTDLDYRHGIQATYNLVEAMRLSGVKKLVFASTSAVYGEAEKKPTAEDYGPLVPISVYGASKLAGEALICAFAHNFAIQTWIFRFANVVGPNLTHGAIYDFVNRLRKSPDQLRVLGNGTQRKSYLHVEDCLEGIWFALNQAKSNVNIFNLSGEGVTDVKTIAELVVHEFGANAKIEYQTDRDRGWKGDIPFTWLDGSRLAALGWRARHSSLQAVELAIHHAVHGVTL